MKFIDCDDTLIIRLEKCTGVKFDTDSTHGVWIEIKNDGEEPAAFLLTADQTIKLALGLLKLAVQAR